MLKPRRRSGTGLGLTDVSNVANSLPSIDKHSIPADAVATPAIAKSVAESVNSKPIPFFVLGALLRYTASVKRKTRVDIDKEDRASGDPMRVEAYVRDIFSNFKQSEKLSVARADPGYVDRKGAGTTRTMRAILLDWMLCVHSTFNLREETLFLATSILDRFLSRKSVGRPTLPLLALTCLHIAAKYEEIYFPSLQDFAVVLAEQETQRRGCEGKVRITKSRVEKLRVKFTRMEAVVLNTVCFELTVPTPLTFLTRFLKANVAQSPFASKDGIGRNTKGLARDRDTDEGKCALQKLAVPLPAQMMHAALGMKAGKEKENVLRGSMSAAKNAAMRAAFFSQNRMRQKSRRPSVANAPNKHAKRKSRISLVPHLARYFCHLALLDSKMLEYLPSHIAAAAVFAARQAVALERPWTGTLCKYCGYSAPQLQECVDHLRRLRSLALKESAGKKMSPCQDALAAGARNAAEKFSSHDEQFVALLPIEPGRQ